MSRWLMGLLSAIFVLPVFAADIKGIAGFSADFGGDQLMPSGFLYTDGSKPDIDAGRGIDMWGGVVAPLATLGNGKLDLQVTAGYKFTTIVQAENGNVTWTHVPVNVGVIWRPASSKLGIGAGVSYQLNNKLKGSGVTSGVTADYDNAIGYQMLADWMFSEKFSIFGKYQIIEYVRSTDGHSANGSNLGVGLGFYFQ